MGKGPPDYKSSLEYKFPELCRQIDYKKSLLEPSITWPGSNTKIWWKCDIGPDHSWETSICKRVAGTGCPFCSKPPRKVSITNCLDTLFPEVAAKWDLERNILSPKEIFSKSNKRFWWKCDIAEDHKYESPVERVVGSYLKSRNFACPYCSGFKPSVTNKLEILYPEITKELHPTKNNNLSINSIIAGSEKKIWWKCKEGDDHEWEQSPGVRSQQNVGCPYCAGQRVSSNDSLATKYPHLIQEWHPTKNGAVLPTDVQALSGIKVWWKCPIADDHEWEAVIDTRSKRGYGCPFCANRSGSGENNKVSNTNRLTNRFPKIAEQWHPIKNGELSPDNFVFGSHTKIWWQCMINPEHEWNTKIFKRTMQKTGCPSCAKYGINLDEPTKYYSISIENHSGIWWWKGGLSVEPSRRAKQIQRSLYNSGMDLKVIVQDQIDFPTGREAIDFEKKLLDEIEIRVSTIEKFTGSTELFNNNPIEYARSKPMFLHFTPFKVKI